MKVETDYGHKSQDGLWYKPLVLVNESSNVSGNPVTETPHNPGTLRTQFQIHEPCPACIVGASGGNPDDGPPTWAAFIRMYASLGLADDHVTMRITTPKSKYV